jgi:uncharacterized membrane protein HdeD (DUF308 family)
MQGPSKRSAEHPLDDVGEAGLHGGIGGVGAAFELQPEDAKRARKWLQVTGILALVAGFVAFIVPTVATVTVAILLGWVLIFIAAVTTVDALSMRDTRRMLARGAWALLALVAGIYLIASPLHGTVGLTFVLATWLIAVGALRLLVAYRERGFPGAGMVGFNGALSLLLGLLIALGLPSSADWAIGLLVGIDLIFYGITALALAGLLKRVAA